VRFTADDIDRLGSDYGYCGERRGMKEQVGRVDRAVLKAANDLPLSEEEFGEWLRSKNGRWFAEDDGFFFRPVMHEGSRHRVPVDKIVAKATESMKDMRARIADGSWF
jgi:hypothetical protein